jgi:hypothetical protein
MKVKINVPRAFRHNDKIPPLLPTAGKKAHSHSALPHNLQHKDPEIPSSLVSCKARKSSDSEAINSLTFLRFTLLPKPLILKDPTIIEKL